jgi:hypothetical protein
MKTSPQFVLFALLLAAVPAGLLSGCSANFVPSPVEPAHVPIGNIQGAVHGGQAPVSGAHIYLYAAGTGGYGTTATSLISATAPNAFQDGNGSYYVLTDANGNFALGGDYTCTQGTQVYTVAVGGNPGLTDPNTNNTAIVQMAGLGQCPAAGNLAAQVPYLVINEVSTVAFAYSMGGFATTAYNVSSNAAASTASATAIANAMANTGNIVNLRYGQAPTVANGNPNSTNPQAKIYALANILAACVNTSSPASSACTALFNASKSSAGVAPTDEATAILNIVHNPGQNVSTLYGLMPAQGVFSPSLTSQPADWTLPILYPNVCSPFGTTGGAPGQVTSGAFNIAFDVSGNAWIGDRVKGVVEMSPLGAVTTLTNPTFGMVKGIAVSADSSQIWVTDYQKNQVYVMTTSGSITNTLTRDLFGPSAVAFDDTGNALVVSETTPSMAAYDSTGTFLDYSGAFSNINTPAWIALDQNGDAWIPSTNSAFVGEAVLNYAGKSGNLKSNFHGFSSITTRSAAQSYGVVVDSSDNVWYASNAVTTNIFGQTTPNNENLYEFVPVLDNKGNITDFSSGGSKTGSGYNGGGLGIPYKITVDGGNNIWMANEYYQTVSEYSQSLGKWMGVPGTQGGLLGIGEVDATGYSNGSTGGTVSATPDNSGNLWTANTDGSVTVLLGAATPTANPIHPSVLGTEP